MKVGSLAGDERPCGKVLVTVARLVARRHNIDDFNKHICAKHGRRDVLARGSLPEKKGLSYECGTHTGALWGFRGN